MKLGRPLEMVVVFICFVPATHAIHAEDRDDAATNAAVKLTFCKDIAPIVFNKCACCHRPGEVAPFPLLNYGDVKKRSRSIAVVTGNRYMPPWKAEHGDADFANDRRLSDEQIAMIKRWVNEGLSEGNPADLPRLPNFSTGWKLGTPDIIAKMDKPIPVPLEGRDIFRTFIMPVDIPKGKYVRAVEYLPGTRSVVHHAAIGVISRVLAQKKYQNGAEGVIGAPQPPNLLPGPSGIWTPGVDPILNSPENAIIWPPESALMLQLHLAPNGKNEMEQSSIGIYLSDVPPSNPLQIMALINEAIYIPAGEKNYKKTASRPITGDIELRGVWAHMHKIGKTAFLKAKLPDGTIKVLLSIPDWDFNWQLQYEFESPVRLPRNTILEAEWTWDNSAENSNNPTHPPKIVTFGEQTTDEMDAILITWTKQSKGARNEPAVAQPPRESGKKIAQNDGNANTSDPDKPSPGKMVENGKHSNAVMELIRRLDKDGDGKLSFDELTADIPAESRDAIKEQLKTFDKDGDGKLDANELETALSALGH